MIYLKLLVLLPVNGVLCKVARIQNTCRHYSQDKSLQPIKMAFRLATPDKAVDPASKPIIIMHGLLGSKNNWNSLSKAITSKTLQKVYTVDARNHGESAHTDDFSYAHLAEDVKCFIENEQLGPAHVIGHSMGGRAMMSLALKHPQLVASLIVVDISPVGVSPTLKHMSGLFDAMRSVDLRALRGQPLHVVRNVVDKALASVVDDPGVRQFILTNLKSADGDTTVWQCNVDCVQREFFKQMVDFRLPHPTATYDGPTLFIKGGRSDFIKEEDHEGIRRIFPRVHVTSIPDAGHWVHAQKPQAFVQQVVKFYQTL